MTNPIYECVINKNTTTTPIWFMRQAGRYLPEFRKIRKLNPNFINLCLNENLSAEITIQPLKRYDICLLYTSPSPRDKRQSRMPSSA